MQVHFLHRDNLGIAATGCAAFHPKTGAKRGFADTNGRPFSDAVKPVAQPNSGGGFAFACGCRVDRGDQDKLAVGLALNRVDKFLTDLCLIVAVGQKMFGGNIQFGADLLDRFFIGFAGNFNV